LGSKPFGKASLLAASHLAEQAFWQKRNSEASQLTETEQHCKPFGN